VVFSPSQKWMSQPRALPRWYVLRTMYLYRVIRGADTEGQQSDGIRVAREELSVVGGRPRHDLRHQHRVKWRQRQKQQQRERESVCVCLELLDAPNQQPWSLHVHQLVIKKSPSSFICKRKNRTSDR
jgi:hypothetical protein